MYIKPVDNPLTDRQTDRQTASAHSSSPSRSAWLDVLKSLAMLGVILVHFNNGYSSPVPILSRVSAIGARCPQMFFIISAYLTWSGLERRGMEWTAFYRKRFIRIAPIYYLALVVAVLIPTVRIVSNCSWISHITFTNGLIPVWMNDVMGGEWYLADLALFYMLCPLIWKMVRGIKRSLIGFAITTLLSTVALILYNTAGGSEIQDVQMYFETFFILHQLPVMMLGIVLYYGVQALKGADKKTVMMVLLASAVIIAASGITFIVFHMNKRYMTSSLIAGLAWTWMCLAAWSVRGIFEKRGWKPLAFIGIHSFGIYCFPPACDQLC